MRSKILSILPRWLVPAVLALGLAACGGGSSSGSSTPPVGCGASCGNAMLTITDAPGDFASYKVGVTSVKLTKADGTVVETLPAATMVDFTQLVDVTELVGAASIPAGEYVAATMTLDYSSASIFVYTDAADTQTTQVGQVVTQTTSGGTTTTTQLWPAQTGVSSQVQVTVQLDSAHHFFVSPGKLSRLALDFNLANSNTVAQTSGQWVVTVQPTLLATAVPTDTKSIRVRGSVASVDLTAQTYTVNVTPFDDHQNNGTQVTVKTTAATAFEVDGKALNQADGLTALNTDGAGTPTIAFGTLSTADGSFTASQVLAGTSVQNSKLDRLRGVVVARPACPTGTATGVVCLMVRGGHIEDHVSDDDSFTTDAIMVEIGSNTLLTVAGNPSAQPTLASPSVGSRVTVFGNRQAATSATSPMLFDATAGLLRLEVTSLWGVVTSTGVGTSSITLNLQAIDGIGVGAFDFTGTGSDPANYVVATGALPLTNVAPSAALRFFGFVQPFGSAPPDFNAMTLVNFTNTEAYLDAGFGMGSTAALTVGATSLTLNVADPALGWMHFIKVGPQVIDLTKLTSNLTITPDAGSSGPFVIRSFVQSSMSTGGSGDWEGSVSMYDTAAAFLAALTTDLATSGTTVQQVMAAGSYDATSNTFTAEQIMVNLN
ncbi:MAG: DUF4382 domain-containing protein [Proteobacteria bacterium]|nr:DUF4382 domain-containing protein [Pseudomonadota bacterium]